MTTVAGPAARRAARGRSVERSARRPLVEREEPWGVGPLVLFAILAGLGLTGMVVGWAGISGTADLEEQARWLGLGIASLILAGFGMVAWLLAGLVSVGTLRRSVVRDLALRTAAEPRSAEETGEQAPVGTFGIGSGMTRYHRSECDILAGKNVRWLDSEALKFAGALPCGMCSPEDASA
ncbi:MAG: hypothetical protein ACT4QG_21870 [Sporichthyaceae bacterium]